MDDIVRYGKMKSETRAEENEIAHQIVREIGIFGVNDRQRWLIMYYLAMELEDVGKMREVTKWIADAVGDDLFIAPKEDE